VDLDERGQRILVVRELERELLAARPGRDRGERLVGVRLDLLARAEELAEDLELLLPFLEILVVREDALGALQLAESLLGLESVRPETGLAGRPLELFLLFRGFADVKDSRGGRSRTTRARAGARFVLRSRGISSWAFPGLENPRAEDTGQ
jgi:hypothetical protein